MKFKRILALSMATALVFVTGCSQEEEVAETTTEAKETTIEAEETPTEIEQVTEISEYEKSLLGEAGYFPQLQEHVDGEILATIKTNMGDISLRLFPDEAPKAVENFVTHSKDGYYNGVTFHRVIKDFMIQGGDPQGTGAGGESIWGKEFENEVSSSLRNFRGALCMANAGPDTNGSQFYIVQCGKIQDLEKQQLEGYLSRQEEYLTPQSGLKVKDIYSTEVINEYIKNGGYPSLDFQYTVFGQVCEGMDVVDAIAQVETDSSDKPVENVVINSIEIQE